MSKKRSKIWSLSKDEIQEKVDQCYSISDMLEIFGYKKTSGSMASIMKEVIEKHSIDTSHFDPYKRNRLSNTSHPQYSLDEILVSNSTYANIQRLKKRIVKAGLLEYKCECCGNTGEWMGNPLTLQLDHKDGDHFNHSIENLRFLCPNCHSQTETFSGKNVKRTNISSQIV